MSKISVGIIDSQTLFRKGLVAIIESSANFKVVFEIDEGDEVLKLKKHQLPEIVISDLRIDSEHDKGLDLVEGLRKIKPEIKIIILTSYYNTVFINLMKRVGINAFLPKQISSDELVKAIQKVSDERIYLTESYKDIILYNEMSNMEALQSKFHIKERLSKRELEVLHLICHEYTNSEISKKLFLSIRTVEGHRNSLLSKTGAKNTVGLVLYTLINRLVTLDYKMLQISMKTPF